MIPFTKAVNQYYISGQISVKYSHITCAAAVATHRGCKLWDCQTNPAHKFRFCGAGNSDYPPRSPYTSLLASAGKEFIAA